MYGLECKDTKKNRIKNEDSRIYLQFAKKVLPLHAKSKQYK